MRKIKNQNGAISLFVLLSMLFFLVFMIGTFSLVSKRSTSQIQILKETQELYKSGLTGKEIYDSMFEAADTVIPISNKEQLIKVIELKNPNNVTVKTVNYIINGKMYTYTKDAKYILQNNIVLDLKDEIDGKNNITIYDYILYTNSYDIDMNGYDIYYAQEDGSLWKCVSYQNIGTPADPKLFSNDDGNTYFYGKSYSPERYSILKDKLNSYKQEWNGIDCFEFMLMYNSNNQNFDTDDKYNRWRQKNNPITEQKQVGQTKAEEYNINFYNDDNNTNVEYYSGRNGIDSSDYNWGGLMRSDIEYYYLAGGVQSQTIYYDTDILYYTNSSSESTSNDYDSNIQYYYPVGKTTFDGQYGITVTPNINASECLLFVRVK